MAKSDPDCIFCKIVAGDLSSQKVFENKDVVAFLDIRPLSSGHTLVVPKEHYTDLLSTPPDVLCKLTAAIPGISAAVVRATGAEGFNLLQSNDECAGQVVPHVHFHVIPRKSNDGIGLGFRHSPAVKDDLGETAKAIRAAL